MQQILKSDSRQPPGTTIPAWQIQIQHTKGTTRTVIRDFSAEAAVTAKFVRMAARYQEDGTLVATRIWASSQFNSVWLSPEGHVLHVNTATNVVTVQNESGAGVDLVVDANTQFFFRQPQNGLADTTPIATGTAFITNQDLVRGFKVHASVVDPLATPLDDYSVNLDYIDSASANGTDPMGNALLGY